MIFCAEPLIVGIYGKSFINATNPFYILIIGTIIYSSVKSVNTVFAGIGRVDLFAKIPLISAVTNISLNFLLISLYGINGAATATAISLVVYVIVMIYLMKKIVGINFDKAWWFKACIILFASVITNNIFTKYS